MRILILLLVFFTTAQASVEVSSKVFVKNCLRGYKKSIRYMNEDKVDPLAPQDSNAVQLCQSLYHNDTEYKYFPWVMESISFLKVPKNDIKLAEFSTPEGNCELGSYFAQKMYQADLSVRESMKFAKSVCRKQ